jgi:predicted RND superfamily exporter protein
MHYPSPRIGSILEVCRVLRHVLAKFQSAILEHPRAVLVLSGALLVLAVILGLGVEFRTSRSELAPEDDPEQQRMNRFVEETGGGDLLIACVRAREGETATTDELRAYADRLAASLERDPLVARVFYRIPLDWIFERGLYLADPETLDTALARFREQGDLFDTLATLNGLAGLNEALADRLERALDAGTALPDDSPERVAPLVTMLRAQHRLLDSPEAFVADIENRSTMEALAGANPRLASGGYLTTRDGDVLFVMITPSHRDDSLKFLRAFIRNVRNRAAEISQESPAITVALTGQPAMTVEEMDTVRRDTWFTSAVAVIGVTLLTIVVFKWRTHAALVLATLMTGVVWALGAVRLEYGYLNMITSSAISTLIGVGVAYSIHPVSEYELEGAHTIDPLAAVRESFHRTGAPVAVAAITTSAAFFSILLMQFRGFAEMGLVAGIGVLLCLAASLIMLPALLLVYGRRRRRRREPGRKSAAVDRFWVESVAAHVCRFPKTVTVIALLLTAALAWMATGIGFNSNLLDLLPAESEALTHQRIMVDRSDMSPIAGLVLADDLDELVEMRRRAAKEPSILRFDSVLQFMPEDVAASEGAVGRVLEFLEGIRLPETLDPVDPATLEESLWRLEEVLAIASEDAFGAGLGEVAGALEDARAEVEASANVVAGAGPGSAEAWTIAEEALRRWSVGVLRDLRRAASAGAPRIDDLPPEVRERFVTDNDRYVVILQPRGSVFDEEILDEYFHAVRRVSPETTGFPVVFHDHSKRITDGFYLAVAVGIGLVLLILVIDYRDLRHTLLSALPLAMGVVWMMGFMRLFGMSFNFANLVAVPLIIGVGIDNGVHIIHRVRLEGVDGMTVVLRHTARAILIASLTTMIGFGSLALASHRGMASLGTVLLLGVGSCLLTSIIVLPNLLVALGLTRR